MRVSLASSNTQLIVLMCSWKRVSSNQSAGHSQETMVLDWSE